MLALLVADAASHLHARHIQEWRVSNLRAVHGAAWRVAELQFFADTGCSRPLRVANDSVYSSHPYPKQATVNTPALHPGADCVDACKGRPGYCQWCGRGNACCRKGFQADPKECKQAKAFATSHHECVSLPGVTTRVTSGGAVVLDGDPLTSLAVKCDDEAGAVTACSGGALVLGGEMAPEASAVRCIAVLQGRGDAVTGGAVHATLAQRPKSPLCPGPCRSGRYLEAHEAGVCKEYLGQHGDCGSTPEHVALGIDCRECARLAPLGRHVEFRVVERELILKGQLVRSRLLPSDGALWRPKAAPLQHAGEDCWGPTCIGGYCPWCGEGNACCKHGNLDDLPECLDATGWVAISHHECVALMQIGAVAGGPLPTWLLACAVVVPWLVGCSGLAALVCRRKACPCCAGRKEPAPGPKELSGDVFVPRGGRKADWEEDARRKVREEAKKLEWLT